MNAPGARAHFPLRTFVLIMLLAAGVRALVIVSNSVSFHSDEAVVGLMARHILGGARPVFFYGQAYMGSLDAWLNALGFALFSPSVIVMRVVQSALYLAVVASGMALAWSITRDRVALIAAGLLLAIPSVLLTTYTTATLGGYGETLLLGNLLMLTGAYIGQDKARLPVYWLVLGVIAGVGWWTNALIAIYAAAVGLMLLAKFWRSSRSRDRQAPSLLPAFGEGIRRRWQFFAGVMLALIGFVIGGAPWWVFALQTDFAPLAFLTGGGAGSSFAGTDVFTLPFDQRLIGFGLIGLPTLIGLRFPWTPDYFLPVIGVPMFALVIFGVVRGLKGQPMLGAFFVIFTLIFLASRFSFDPTGRYFLPLAVPVAVTFGAWIGRVYLSRRVLAAGLLCAAIGYQAAGSITTASTEPGFTTQFNLDTHIPNTDDAALIAFLDENQLYNGYTQYWIAFRLAFLSGERMQYSATLPYLPSLNYTPLDERYPPYRRAADAAERGALIIAETTPNVAPIRAALEDGLNARGITYQVAQIGAYRVYYDFAPDMPRPPFDF